MNIYIILFTYECDLFLKLLFRTILIFRIFRYLNQLRKNRDEERELMKNVPGWKVGHYFSEPLYTTVGDFLMEPDSIELYAHTHDKHRDYMHMYAFWM